MTNDYHPLDSLVEGVIARQEESFRLLYERTATPLASFAYRQLRDRGAAEDAVQQAFLELASSAHRFRGDGRSLAAWLYRSVRFSVLDEVRRRSRHPEIPGAELPELPAALDPGLGGVDPDLEAALDLLSPAQRSVLLLRHVEGFNPTEIAGILGMTRAGVYATSARAEAALRKRLRAIESGPPPASPPTESTASTLP